MDANRILTTLRQADPFLLVINLIVALCVTIIFSAITINFLEAREKSEARKEKRTVVDTFTMTLFFVAFFVALKLRLLVLDGLPMPLRRGLAVLGLLIIILGTVVNILGRINLGKNWGNQIRIYQDHTFVCTGVYRCLRHPLYASTIWMFFGAVLIYVNLAALLALVVVFIPFMILRVRQEERLLVEIFPQYNEYRKKVGMFSPTGMWEEK